MYRINELYDLEHTAAKDYLLQFTYPWEALSGIKDFILKLGESLDKEEYVPSFALQHLLDQIAWLGIAVS